MSYSSEIEAWLSNEAVHTGATMKEVLDVLYDGSKKIQYEHTRREFYKLKYE